MSDATTTDQAEFRRKKIIEYNTALADFKLELQEQNTRKKDRILGLAKILEDAGYDKQKICAQVTHDLKGEVNDRYIREILGVEYKEKKFANKVGGGNTASIENNQEQEQKKPLLVTNNGETVDQKAESALDEIYGGKSFTQMEKEARREIQEDKEETLENPNNRVPLLSAIPPEIREKLAKFDEMEEMVRQMAEDRDHAIQKANEATKQLRQLKYGEKEEELRRLKIAYNNLLAEYSDVDRQALEKEGYKEIEVLKLDPGTVRLLTTISNKSQRTLFLIVHPKTMKIKEVRTDVQQHQIQVRRAAGVL